MEARGHLALKLVKLEHMYGELGASLGSINPC